MKLNQLFLVETINASQVFLHGGRGELKGGQLKRHGMGNGQDMGALFFVPETKDGYRYAIAYASFRDPENWAVYRVKLNINDNEIFNFTNPEHKKIAKQNLSRHEYDSWEKSKGSSGHLDWTLVDDEMFEEWGFKAAVFHERPKSIGYSNDVVSIGLFDAKYAEIIEVLKERDIKEKMPNFNPFLKPSSSP